MTFQLKCFRSLWGAPSAARLANAASTTTVAASVSASSSSSSAAAAATATKEKALYGERLITRLAAQGYDGLEASLSDLELLGGPRHAAELLAAHDMKLIVGVYSGWTDYEPANLHEHFEGVAAHLGRYRRQLEEVATGIPRPQLAWINAHSGCDHWGKLDQMEFIAHALELETELGLPPIVSHETHRGRIFYSPWPTLELLAAFPSLKLTLDASHWCVVTERLLDDPEDQRWLRRVLPHVHHVHGRMGTAQCSQIPVLPTHPAVADETRRFEALWEDIWRLQHTRFHLAQDLHDADAVATRPFSTFTPEYGPLPYAPMDPVTQEEAYDVDQLCVNQMQRQRGRFEALVQTLAVQESKLLRGTDRAVAKEIV